MIVTNAYTIQNRNAFRYGSTYSSDNRLLDDSTAFLLFVLWHMSPEGEVF